MRIFNHRWRWYEHKNNFTKCWISTRKNRAWKGPCVLILSSFFNGWHYPPLFPSLFFPFSYKKDRDTAVSWRLHFFSILFSSLWSPHLISSFTWSCRVLYPPAARGLFFYNVHRQVPINVAFPGVAFIPTWGFIQTCWHMLQTANTTTVTRLRNL